MGKGEKRGPPGIDVPHAPASEVDNRSMVFEKPGGEDFPYHVRIKRDKWQDVWLVPERTGTHEVEITIADLRMFHVVRQAFPGCTIEEIKKP